MNGDDAFHKDLALHCLLANAFGVRLSGFGIFFPSFEHEHPPSSRSRGTTTARQASVGDDQCGESINPQPSTIKLLFKSGLAISLQVDC